MHPILKNTVKIGDLILKRRPGYFSESGVVCQLNPKPMIRNYLTTCFRSLARRKLFSLINILGLATGMAVTLVLWKVVAFELSFDKYHKKAGSVFRVTSSIYSGGGDQWAVVGYDLGPSLQGSIPEVEQFTRRHPFYGDAVVTYFPSSDNPVRFTERNLQFVDGSFFGLFDFTALYGDLTGALSQPYTIALTRPIAEKYFGKGINPVGNTLHLSQYGEFQVIAVLDDAPENSHIDVDILLPMENLLNNSDYKNSNARLENFITYVELSPGSDEHLVEWKMSQFLTTYLPNDPYTAGRFSDNSTSKPTIQLQPITEVHLSVDGAGAGQNEGGSINTVYFLITISIFILAIAWVNYINLSTARAMERAREVGIRKAIGTSRRQLIQQFILESVIVNLISLSLAVLMAFPILDLVNSIMDKNFFFNFSSIQIWVWLLTLLVAGSCISGFYPAFILSSFKVTDVIKGNIKGEGFNLRKALVVFQFASSLVLIIGTFVMYRQIGFMQRENNEAHGGQILILHGPEAVDSANFSTRLLSFKNSLQQLPSIQSVATSDAVPGSGYNWAIHAGRRGAAREHQVGGQNMEVVFVDPDFLKVYDIELTAGRNWDQTSATEMKSILINEATVDPFGFSSSHGAVGESMVFNNNEFSAPILGVVRNIHWYSLKNKFTPMILWPQEVCAGWFSVRISDNIEGTLPEIEKLFKAYFPNGPFEYYFHDDFFNRQYQSEQSFRQIFSLFAVLAIFIACLGLWGLAAFASFQRIREIGIRRVLGASSGGIVILLSIQFLKLLVVACVVALPVVWVMSDKWLDNFAFRIGLSYDLFLIPSMTLLLIGMATVSIHTIRAARSNPVDTIRS